ncbi:hypothetical protein C9374_010435 [Naegleria lovaniensis]|uniref:Uncharacterized protein n=1 Tax=Naegleria lovaniensis TaxID=51637 RepID=A0AA88KG89_NAELO|nr:uncharacterized protein C9374_010435 [Naegleria lovaniensis]KAG2374691.1 hypothetical protein C9374_010435 [Naegleria lovaniensis]
MIQRLIQSDYFSKGVVVDDANQNSGNNNTTSPTTLSDKQHNTPLLNTQQVEASSSGTPSLQIPNNNSTTTTATTNTSLYSPPSNISLYFQYIANLDFIQAHTLIRNYQELNQPQKLGSLHSSSSTPYSSSTLSKYKQNEEEVIQSLKRFIQCETLYYDANYSPNEKQDLHSLYSLLSSNLSLIAMNAPYEYLSNSNNNGSSNSPYMDMHHSQSIDQIHSSHDHLLMMMSMMDQTQSGHMDTMNATSSVVDYIVYKMGSSLSPTTSSSSHYYHQLTLIDKEFILSKQIIKDFRMLIQLRLEIIAFYRILSRYKHPPKYDNYVRIINSLKSKYINRIGHQFFERIVQNINMELNTLISLFECEYNICNYKYKESVFTMWKTKHLFKQWNELFYKWKIEMNEIQSHYWTQPQNFGIMTTTTTTPSRGDAISNLSSVAAMNTPSIMVQPPHMGNISNHHLPTSHESLSLETSATSSTTSLKQVNSLHTTTNMNTNTTTSNTINTNTITPTTTNTNTTNNTTTMKSSQVDDSSPNNLNKTNLFKWMTMIFGFSQSKFTFIFHDIITNQSSMIVNNLLNHHTNGTMNDHHSPLIPPSLAVDYIQWIQSFNEIVKPESVCLIYNATHDHLDTTPILETDPEKGYVMRIRSQENTEDLSLSGIKLYPCVFHYPTTFIQEGSSGGIGGGMNSSSTGIGGGMNSSSVSSGIGGGMSSSSSGNGTHSQSNSHTTNSTTTPITTTSIPISTTTTLETTATPERKITKQTLMYTYWPNLLSLIMENGSDLEVAEEAFYFTDPKTFTTYYLCMVTPKLYLASIVIKPTSKDHQIALKFMAQMNNFIRNRKVFNYLTSVIPQQPQSSNGKNHSVSSQASPHSSMKMTSPSKSASKFSLFGGSKKK